MYQKKMSIGVQAMACFNINSFSRKKGAWIRYVAAHSPLTVEDIKKHRLYEFVKGHELREEITTKELIEIAGRGWGAELCIGILKVNHGDYSDL